MWHVVAAVPRRRQPLNPLFSPKNADLRRAIGAGGRAGFAVDRRSMPAALLMLALYEPDIAVNAGAMMRTCACLGIDAAIIEPAGFAHSDRRFRRAGMDYLAALRVDHHASFARFEDWRAAASRRLVLLTTRGETELWDFAFRPGDILMVGRESAGVPPDVAAAADARMRISIRPPLRSLNVGIAAALAIGEALRQLRYVNAAREPGAQRYDDRVTLLAEGVTGPQESCARGR
jgi:tRNA (cytidine/uridine-2'-O-)-methyltransferase